MNNILKLKKIRIKNYKSIIDSGNIDVDDRIITLAGKNESGKTTILNSLLKFGNDNFTDDDIPNGDNNANPLISIEYTCKGKEIKNILPNVNDSKEYNLVIKRSKNEYDDISGLLYDLILDYVESLVLEICKGANENDLSIITNKLKSLLNYDEPIDLNNLLVNYYKNQVSYGTKTNVQDLENILMMSDSLKDKIPDDISEKADYKLIINILERIFNCVNEKINQINNIFPNYVYFDSFNDMIPDEIEYKKLDDKEYQNKNRGFINLLDFLEVDVVEFIKICSGEKRDVNRKLSEYSKKFTGYFENIYKQETITINLRRDGDYVIVELYDNDTNVVDTKPSQRSKGFQWFFAFFLVLENQKNNNTVLLIDEPGLYLHAKAQEDILSIFENNIENQIFYTTHSPYLINTDEMSRIKLVIRNQENNGGTKIVNKYYATSDIETMTPIISAIGYNISKSPIGFGKDLNIITEGVSDRYYLLAFYKLLKCSSPISIIPSIGASKTYLLASLCVGWGINHYILLDNDSGGFQAMKTLKKIYYQKTPDFVKKVPKSGSIENLFSDNNREFTWYKGCEKDKLATAKQFYDNVMNKKITIDNLDDETITNIKDLFHCLKIH